MGSYNFTKRSKWLGFKGNFDNDKELQEDVTNWLKSQNAEFYEEGISINGLSL